MNGASSRRWRVLGSYGVLLLGGYAFGCLERREGDTSESRPECSECHGGLLEVPFSAAPPFNLSGRTEPTERGNGAHEAHLLASSRARPVACEECHEVPTKLYQKGHVDTEYPAEVRFQGPAKAFEAEPVFVQETATCAETFCHGGYFVGGRPSGGGFPEPVWTSQDAGVTACTGCHGMPPPAPHPDERQCSDCHKNIEPNDVFSHPELHVDGVVNFYLPSR